MRRYIEIILFAFWKPDRAVDRSADRVGIQGIQALIAACYLIAGTLAGRFISAWCINALPDSTRPEAVRMTAETLTKFGYASLLAGLLIQVVSWYIVAGFLYILNTIVRSREVDYTSHLSLSVVSSLYGILAQYHVILVWYIKGTSAFESLNEILHTSIGLNLIPIQMSLFYWNLLGHVNIYELCSTLYLSYGFVRLTGAKRLISYGSIFVAWTLISIARAAISK